MSQKWYAVSYSGTSTRLRGEIRRTAAIMSFNRVRSFGATGGGFSSGVSKLS